MYDVIYSEKRTKNIWKIYSGQAFPVFLFFVSVPRVLWPALPVSLNSEKHRQIKPWNNPLESSEALEASKIQGRECYYFYISFHLSPILKQLNVFLLSLHLHLVSRGARLQLPSGARGSSRSETRGLRKGWVWESLVRWLCPGGGWQPWGNWTPTSDVWASGAPLTSLELCLC